MKRDIALGAALAATLLAGCKQKTTTSGLRDDGTRKPVPPELDPANRGKPFTLVYAARPASDQVSIERCSATLCQALKVDSANIILARLGPGSGATIFNPFGPRPDGTPNNPLAAPGGNSAYVAQNGPLDSNPASGPGGGQTGGLALQGGNGGGSTGPFWPFPPDDGSKPWDGNPSSWSGYLQSLPDGLARNARLDATLTAGLMPRTIWINRPPHGAGQQGAIDALLRPGQAAGTAVGLALTGPGELALVPSEITAGVGVFIDPTIELDPSCRADQVQVVINGLTVPAHGNLWVAPGEVRGDAIRVRLPSANFCQTGKSARFLFHGGYKNGLQLGEGGASWTGEGTVGVNYDIVIDDSGLGGPGSGNGGSGNGGSSGGSGGSSGGGALPSDHVCDNPPAEGFRPAPCVSMGEDCGIASPEGNYNGYWVQQCEATYEQCKHVGDGMKSCWIRKK